jgi:spermidine/putrescine transport system substrate-binding protein
MMTIYQHGGYAMNNSSRRDAIKVGLGGAALAMLPLPSGPARAQVRQTLKGPLNVIIHCHTVGKAEDIALFKESAGIETNVSCFTTNTDVLTRMVAGAGRQFDAYTMNIQFLKPVIQRGLAAPQDWSKIPNTENMLPMFKNPLNSTIDGKHYSLPWMFGYDSVIYNRDVIPECDSYAVLFDDKYAGRVTMRDDPQFSIIIVALYMQKPNPLSLNSKDLKEISDFLIKKKKNFRSLWSGFAEPVSLMKSGEVVAVGQGWIPIYRELKKSGMNVGFALLKEKVTSWTQDLVIPPQAMERGMADSVYAFMNWVIGPEMGARMGRSVGYVSPSGAALSLLSPAEAQEIGYDDIEKVWRNSLPVTEFPDNLQEWNDAWSRFKAA